MITAEKQVQDSRDPSKSDTSDANTNVDSDEVNSREHIVINGSKILDWNNGSLNAYDKQIDVRELKPLIP